MALFDRGSTLTLYGGSVLSRWIPGPVEEPRDVLRARAVPAEEPVPAEDDQIAPLGRGLVRGLGDLVGVGQPVGGYIGAAK